MDFMKELKARLEGVRGAMEMNDAESLLISTGENLFYLTGKDTGRALITPKEAILWVKEPYNQLYEDIYSNPGYGFDVRLYEKGIIENEIKRRGLRKLYINNISFGAYQKFAGDLKADIEVSDIVEKRRAIKSRYEIAALRRSAGIAVRGMGKANDIIAKGVTEIDAVAEIEREIRVLGSETPPFKEGMLLSSGINSADIHAHASGKNIENGDMVVVDLGARCLGYFSDMTRTIKVGGVGKEEERDLEFVENLELETIDKLQPGINAGEIHSGVEGEMEKRGFRFYHSTGHGVGLNIHEIPNIGRDSDDILKEGMVFTIEPGIYIPHKYGIRFEDMILLTRKGPEILTR
ncbi:MAG: aminopeptidase P family protein [Candidatus Altiarchaeales archaeon]|nr:aminopeptidase P family protein [Candidatus Altiarchaeales archaeon]